MNYSQTDKTNGSSSRSRVVAIVVTALIALLAGVWMAMSTMSFTPREEEWPPQPHFDIELQMPEEEEQFVEVFSSAGEDALEDFDSSGESAPSDVTNNTPTQTSHDLSNAGSNQGHASDLLASNADSPLEHKRPKTEGTRTPVDSAAIKAAREQASIKTINEQVKFTGAGGNGEGRQAKDTEGTTPAKGTGGGKGLQMTASHDVRPVSKDLGTIVVSVVVLPDGSVKPNSAKIVVSECRGDAGINEALRRSTLVAAYSCRFTRQVGESDNLPGTIFFVWK